MKICFSASSFLGSWEGFLNFTFGMNVNKNDIPSKAKKS